MNGLDVCITSKVPVIAGQNPFDAMYSHRGGQPRIVDLNARHAMRDKQVAPLCMDRQAVGGAIGGFLRRILLAGPFLEEKERSRRGR